MQLHETLHRGEDAMEALCNADIVVCGAGAIGANLAESLVRMGAGELTVIDDDRVEERNLSTQPYGRRDVGAAKVQMLANDVYRAVGTEIETLDTRLDGDNVGDLLGRAEWVVDCFDNSRSREVVTTWCRRTATPCLHVGMAEGYGECVWNETYDVPSDARDDVCDYPLSRSLVLVTVGMACELLVDAIDGGEHRDASMTLGDLEMHTSR